jgi:hypothetical protein
MPPLPDDEPRAVRSIDVASFSRGRRLPSTDILDTKIGAPFKQNGV